MIKRIQEIIIEIFKSFAVILLFLLVPFYMSKILRAPINSSNFWIQNLSALLCYIVLAIVLFILYHKRLIEDWHKFKKENIGIGIRYWLVGCLIMIISNSIILYFAKDIAVNEASNRELINAMPLFSIITMCLITPFNEEITFRLSMKKIFKNGTLYALLSGLVFGALHVISADGVALWYIIPYGALGFMFAKAVDKTDNIYTSMFLHMLHNSFTILMLYVSGGIL